MALYNRFVSVASRLSRQPALLAAAASTTAAAITGAAACACAAAPEPATAAAAQSATPPASSAWPSPLKTVSDTIYENVIAPYAEPSREKLLPDLPPNVKGREKPTLVISLDGTLIESQWTRQFGWRYIKRPGVDDFLRQLHPLYELVLWTDAQNTADPVVDRLDPQRLFRHRLYRDATTYMQGEHKKDLRALNRDLDKVLIIDCSASSFSLQPKHGIAVKPYRVEQDPLKEDSTLKNLVPFLQFVALNQRLKGSTTPFHKELEALGVSTTIEDGGVAFQKAVDARFAELRAAGKMPMQRGRGSFMGGGGDSSGAAAAGGSVWERMGLRKGAQ
jgi:Dullard-like phosphatase family protein|eukprot:jgi/Chrpa1/4171/Chrysochromulina_OHIO_Genome00019996-RA